MSLWLGCIEMQKKTNVQKQLNDNKKAKKFFFLIRLGNILCLKKMGYFVVVVAVIFNLLLKLYAIETYQKHHCTNSNPFQ